MGEGEDVRVPVHVVAGDLEPSCGGGDESALRDETGAITEFLGDCQSGLVCQDESSTCQPPPEG